MVNVRNRDKVLLFGLAVICVALLVFLPLLKEKFLPGVVGDVDQYNPDIKTMMSLLGTSLVFNEKVAADFECSKDRLPTKEKIDEKFQAVCENLNSSPYIGLFWKRNNYNKFDFQKDVSNIFLLNRSANKNILLEGNLECFENKEDVDQTKMRSVRVDCELKITNGVDENDKKQIYTSFIYSYPVEGVSLKVNQVIVVSDDNKELVMAVAKHVYNNVTKIDSSGMNAQTLKYENQWFVTPSAQASGAGDGAAGDGAGDGAAGCGAGDAAGNSAGCDGAGDGAAGAGDSGGGDGGPVDPVIISEIVKSIFVPDPVIDPVVVPDPVIDPVVVPDPDPVLPDPQADLDAESSVIVSSQSSMLTWSSSGYSSCRVDGVSFAPGKSGSGRVSPTETTTYILICDGLPSDFVKITVNGIPTLTASSRMVNVGNNVSLTWNLKGQLGCSLKGGELGTTYNSISEQIKTVSTRVSARTTYTLKCPVGSDVETIDVVPVGFES